MAIMRVLAETASNPVIGASCLSRFRRELKNLNAPKKIISAILNRDLTCLSNKIQKEYSKQCEDEGIYFPDHFLLESVKEKLDSYDVTNISNKQALADVIIILCIHPAKIKNLRISNENVTGYAKNRRQ